MNERTRKLIEERAVLNTEARGLVDTAGKEDRLMTDEENKRHGVIFAEQSKIKDQIDVEKRQIEMNRDAADSELRVSDAEKAKSAGKELNSEERSMVAYRTVLRTNEVSGTGAEEFRALQADSDPAGGYSVPQQAATQLIKAVDDLVFIRALANVIPVTTGDSLGAVSLDADPEDGTWSGEIQEFDEDTAMKFGKRELNPTAIKKLVKVSKKLLRTSTLNIDALVRDRLAYKFGITQEKGFLTGNGAAQALGVFTASAEGISTGRDVSAGNTNTAITADNLKNNKYNLKAGYRNNAQWVFHRDAIKEVSKLKDGEGRYLWQDSIALDEPDRLLNLPVNESEYAPNTFTSGLYVGILADFSWYWIADSLTMTIQVLLEKYATTSQNGYIADMEVDGMPVLEEAFTRVTLT